MNIPNRLLVLQRLVALFTYEPLVINGVSTDMTGYVFRGRNLLGEESVGDPEQPCISMIESPRPDIAVFAGAGVARSDALTLLVTGIIANDDSMERGDTGYYLYAAVEQRLARIVLESIKTGMPAYPEQYLLGNAITGLEVAPPVIRPEGDKLSSRATFFLPIRVGIAGLLENPYTAVP